MFENDLFNLNPPEWGHWQSKLNGYHTLQAAIRKLQWESAHSISCGEFRECRESADPISAEFLEVIKANGTNLRLSSAQAKFCAPFSTEEKAVYRLYSQENQAYLKFWLHPCFGGFEAHALILAVDPAAQGSFYNFRDFIRRISATLFGLTRIRIFLLTGKAIDNQYPCRAKPHQTADWRVQTVKGESQTKLIRLYQRAGFLAAPNSNWVSLLSDYTLRACEVELADKPKELAEFRALRRYERKPVPRKNQTP